MKQPTSMPSPTATLPPTAPPPGASLGDVWMRPADGMAMLYVPGGEFVMGSSDEELDYALRLCDRASLELR